VDFDQSDIAQSCVTDRRTTGLVIGAFMR